MKLRGSRPGLVSEFTLRLGSLATVGALTVSDARVRSANLVAGETFLLGTISPAGDGPVSAWEVFVLRLDPDGNP